MSNENTVLNTYKCETLFLTQAADLFLSFGVEGPFTYHVTCLKKGGENDRFKLVERGALTFFVCM